MALLTMSSKLARTLLCPPWQPRILLCTQWQEVLQLVPCVVGRQTRTPVASCRNRHIPPFRLLQYGCQGTVLILFIPRFPYLPFIDYHHHSAQDEHLLGLL